MPWWALFIGASPVDVAMVSPSLFIIMKVLSSLMEGGMYQWSKACIDPSLCLLREQGTAMQLSQLSNTSSFNGPAFIGK